MHPKRVGRAAAVALLTATALPWLAAPSGAELQPGDLLVPEIADGAVVNIRGGGDFTGAPRFATGLSAPSSICFGPGDSVYVSAGTEVKIVDAGGDLSAAAAFATGLGGDGRLGCSDSEILVGSNVTGEVFDITGGGDFSAAVPFATGLGLLGGLFRDSNGTLWASAAPDQIFDITAGGDFSLALPFASGAPIGELTEHSGALLVGGSSGIRDFTAGGDLGAAPLFASGIGAPGLLEVPGLGLFAATGNGSGVWEISAGGSFSGVPAYATGVATDFGLASLAFVHGCGDGILDPGESCDDGNTQNGDTCDASCNLGVPEPGEAMLVAVGSLVLLAAGRGRGARRGAALR